MEKCFCFVIGGPGCGKGTQCRKIVESFEGWEHVSIGNLLRDEIKNGTQRSKIAEQHTNQGSIVPLTIVLEVLKDALDRSTAKKFLIDGYPRDSDQVKAFEEKIGDFVCALYFDCPDEVLGERLHERSLTSGRSDDTEDTIQKRLKTFKDTSSPVLLQLKAREKLFVIPANKSVDEVFRETSITVRQLF